MFYYEGQLLIFKCWCWLQLMSAPMETLTRAITAGLRRASPFDGANQDHDYYLARAASLLCLETCFPKETTEGQLLSAELFSLLSMCVLAACLWPTAPEQQHETGPLASLLFSIPTTPPSICCNWATRMAPIECTHEMLKYSFAPLARTPCRKLYGCKFWFLCVKQ